MENSKSFYKMIFALVIPIALQNLMNTAVQSADVIMLGRVGEKALSAASLGGQVNFVMGLFLFGLTSGAMVLCSQYWGKQNYEAIRAVFGISLRYALLVAAVFVVFTFAFPDFIMLMLSSDEQVRANGVEYLRILCFCFIFMAITMVYLNIMRSMERVIVSTVVYGISLIVNVAGNAVFIFGLGPVPAMGVKGAAVATLMARITELLIVVFYNYFKNNIIKFDLGLIFVRNKILKKDFEKVSGPVIINEVIWGLGMAAAAAILGQLGSEAASANAIVQVVRQLSTVISFGIAAAAAIAVGKVIGERKMELAGSYAAMLVKMSVVFGAFGSLVVLVVRPIVLSFMELSERTKGYLSVMMFLMAAYVFFQSFNSLMIVGIFRSGGDTKFGLILEIGCLWGGSVLLGMIAAFLLRLRVPLVFAVILCDEYIKIPFTIIRYKSYKWLNDITREQIS